MKTSIVLAAALMVSFTLYFSNATAQSSTISEKQQKQIIIDQVKANQVVPATDQKVLPSEQSTNPGTKGSGVKTTVVQKVTPVSGQSISDQKAADAQKKEVPKITPVSDQSGNDQKAAEVQKNEKVVPPSDQSTNGSGKVTGGKGFDNTNVKPAVTNEKPQAVKKMQPPLKDNNSQPVNTDPVVKKKAIPAPVLQNLKEKSAKKVAPVKKANPAEKKQAPAKTVTPVKK